MTFTESLAVNFILLISMLLGFSSASSFWIKTSVSFCDALFTLKNIPELMYNLSFTAANYSQTLPINMWEANKLLAIFVRKKGGGAK